jgi:hypothetical protein
MQPYFVPYAGYFRLFAQADLFVVYDCVQFPRRGWVHRNRLLDANGNLQWLTLPLAYAERDVTIRDLAFRAQPRPELDAQTRRFPTLNTEAFRDCAFRDVLRDFSGTPVDYLERTLSFACGQLGLPFKTLRSSSLGLPTSLRGEDRILAIVKALSGSTYVNAPGGQDLYSVENFAAQGIELRFLPQWQGDFSSILQRLAGESASHIGQDIRRQCVAETAMC